MMKELARPGLNQPLRVRAVPPPPVRPAFLSHPRLRRTSPIAQYAVAAALEALGKDAEMVADKSLPLGIVYCAMTGCVKYSLRFYEEALRDPMTASPLIFPETVYNAPASHLSALLGTTGINYTLVGDAGTFLQGLALAADWLLAGRVVGCLVIGAEELDWLVAEASSFFDRDGTVSEGSGALYLTCESTQTPAVELHAISEPQMFTRGQCRVEAATRTLGQLNNTGLGSPLYDSSQGELGWPTREEAAWSGWKGRRISPKKVCGEAFMASAAWQCVAAVDALARGACPTATVGIIGANEQAIAAEFVAALLPKTRMTGSITDQTWAY